MLARFLAASLAALLLSAPAFGAVCDLDDDGYKTKGDICGGSDCNDLDPLINPGAREVCDPLAVDEDCNPATSIPHDVDGDGLASIECGGADCDDEDPARYPGAVEICDAGDRDEDCDPTTFGSRDADGDGFVDDRCCNLGDDGVLRCGEDCDDGKRGVHPNQVEVCNHVDDNCDGGVDDPFAVSLYEDIDGDGFGSILARGTFCPYELVADSTLSARGGDCDDSNEAIIPGAQICAGFDAVSTCAFDGTWTSLSCGLDEMCLDQPNGTGVCVPSTAKPTKK
jgi:hypothetical protein